MRSTIRCGVCSTCLTLLVSPDSPEDSRGRARVVSLRGVLFSFFCQSITIFYYYSFCHLTMCSAFTNHTIPLSFSIRAYGYIPIWYIYKVPLRDVCDEKSRGWRKLMKKDTKVTQQYIMIMLWVGWSLWRDIRSASPGLVYTGIYVSTLWYLSTAVVVTAFLCWRKPGQRNSKTGGAPADYYHTLNITINLKNVTCEIEDLVETHLCKLHGILRSRVLRVFCDLIKGC